MKKLLTILIILSLASCNIGLKTTYCPSHNQNWFKDNQEKRFYKH